jgi:hypothetical protein
MVRCTNDSSTPRPTRDLGGENLLALKTERVNPLLGTIEVVESLAEVNGYLHCGPTKTGANRTVSLPRFLSHMLQEHMAAFPKFRPVCVHVSRGRTSSPELLSSALQAGAASSRATPPRSVPRSPPHVRGPTHRPGRTTEGNPRPTWTFDDPDDVRPVRSSVPKPGRAVARHPSPIWDLAIV